ncbi:hypothetical protein J6590_022517 [Homalodisca vitripennis]|nr:hypothetical protein J6590_022517 [Homalodisca vitripennis]
MRDLGNGIWESVYNGFDNSNEKCRQEDCNLNIVTVTWWVEYLAHAAMDMNVLGSRSGVPGSMNCQSEVNRYDDVIRRYKLLESKS